jgi:hypothetical protein
MPAPEIANCTGELKGLQPETTFAASHKVSFVSFLPRQLEEIAKLKNESLNAGDSEQAGRAGTVRTVASSCRERTEDRDHTAKIVARLNVNVYHEQLILAFRRVGLSMKRREFLRNSAIAAGALVLKSSPVAFAQGADARIEICWTKL